MSSSIPKAQELTIVLVGDFNPKIFHPTWFFSQELIKKSDEEYAEIEIIRPEISIFSLEWMKLSVTRDRATFETKTEPYYELLRDLVVSTFRLLNHTPIKMLGINVKKTFRIESTEAWHNYGHTLAPKKPWEGLLTTPGLISTTIQGVRPDAHKGYVQVITGPTPDIVLKNGISIVVNDHYSLVSSEEDTVVGCGEILEILESSWTASMRRSDTIIDSLLRIAQ